MRVLLSFALLVGCGDPSPGADGGRDSDVPDARTIDSQVLPDAPSIDAASDAGASDAPSDSSTGSDTPPSTAGGCPDPLPADWIFCDDFERGDPSADDYFERQLRGGDFHRSTTQSFSGDHSMEVFFDRGTVEAGNLKVAFGDGPVGGGARHREGERFDEIYWRMRVLHQEGWTGNPAKLSRAMMFVGGDWSQGMIAHIWDGSGDFLKGEPVSCVSGSSLLCSGYNDFDNMRWLPGLGGATPVFAAEEVGRWMCIEAHVTLNTPGSSDGVFEFWIDDELENGRSDYDWRGSYTEHGLNAVFFENYWNAGSPVPQRRWFDDLAIAETRIGCE